MARRRHHHPFSPTRLNKLTRKLAGRRAKPLRKRGQYWVEMLEPRCVLSANPWQITAELPLSVEAPIIATSAPYTGTNEPVTVTSMPEGGGGAVIPALHSNPGATKVIYLDFDGHLTQDTPWNDPLQEDFPPILSINTPPYSIDGDGS